MANITLLGASYTDVPAVDLPKTGGGTVRFYENGGTPSVTQHEIYFEFTDETDTTITAYWDGTFISDAVTATTPTTYGGKTVTLAQLDGVTWYEFDPTETWETLYESNDVGFYPESDPTLYPYCWLSSLGDVQIGVDSVWRVTFANSEYRCVAKNAAILNMGTKTVIGNPKWGEGVDDGSDAPFVLYNSGYGSWTGAADLPKTVQSNVYMKIERRL